MNTIDILNKDNLILYFPFNTNLKDIVTGIRCHHYSDDDFNEQAKIINTKYLNDNKFNTALYFNGNHTEIEILFPRKYNEYLRRPSLFAIDFYYYIDNFVNYGGLFRFSTTEDSHIFTDSYVGHYACWMEKYRFSENLYFGTESNNVIINLEKNKWNHFLFMYNNSKYLIYHNEELISDKYIPEFPFEDSLIQDGINFGSGHFKHLSVKNYTNAIFYLKNLKIYYKPEKSIKEKIRDSLPVFFKKNNK